MKTNTDVTAPSAGNNKTTLCDHSLPTAQSTGTVGGIRGAERDRDRDRQAGRQEDRENSNTLFYKDCSLVLVKNLSNN